MSWNERLVSVRQSILRDGVEPSQDLRHHLSTENGGKQLFWMSILLTGSPAPSDFVPPTAINQSDWFKGVDYPLIDTFWESGGLVETDIFIDKSGKPEACYIVVSSGSKDADGQTCAAAMHRGRFTAAVDENGEAMAGIYRFRTRFVIGQQKDAEIPPDVSLTVAKLPDRQSKISMALRYIVDATGRIEKCATYVSSGFPSFDSAACRAMPGRYTFAPARDKAGVARRVVRTQTVAFEVAPS